MTNTTTSAAPVDPALWTTRRAFGAAGGPDEIVLTEEGRDRAWSVGAQVRLGPASRALEALWSVQGEAYLALWDRCRLNLTDLGRQFDGVVWGRLTGLGYVVSFRDDDGDGVRLTKAGKDAAWRGVQERAALLDRICRTLRP